MTQLLIFQAIHAKGAPLTNCWAFIDGTARAICRPSRGQKLYFSGHKRFHALKYQAIMCPNGIICQLDGSYPGSKHDAGNFGISNVYSKLENLVQGHNYCIYGDPAYPLRPLLLKPYGGASLTPEQCAFNKAMSSVRQAVEWGFGKIAGLFAFVDFKKNQKLYLQNVPRIYKASALLANCHTCLYGAQVSHYFGLEPPDLEAYLTPL
ncbi:putative nuclease HARBI1 [Dermacentor andersoni]|uniref:putative nuclease HARBI1 n=1 Tax=Dermacentor andersoni TaxID=34620 RepID=UPI002155E2B8